LESFGAYNFIAPEGAPTNFIAPEGAPTGYDTTYAMFKYKLWGYSLKHTYWPHENDALKNKKPVDCSTKGYHPL
jgi:hypothetical protein